MCLIGIIIHISAQTKIIGRVLEKIDFKKKNATVQLKKCIKETSIIISMVEELDFLLKYVILEQCLVMIITICTFVYIIPQDTEKIGNFLFIFNLSLEPLALGWFSQTLTEEVSVI